MWSQCYTLEPILATLPPHPVTCQSLIFTTLMLPLSRPHISLAHRSPSLPPSSRPWPCISSAHRSPSLSWLCATQTFSVVWLCVHRVTPLPPHIEQQWSWRPFKMLFIAPSPFMLTLCFPFPLPPTTLQSYTGTVLWLNIISLLSSTDYPFTIALRTHPCWLSIQASKALNSLSQSINNPFILH